MNAMVCVRNDGKTSYCKPGKEFTLAHYGGVCYDESEVNWRGCGPPATNGVIWMKLLQTVIEAGATSPFSLLHLSDTHLTLADERDCESKLLLAQRRSKGFPTAEEDLAFAAAYARSKGHLLVHTGDLIDFVSEANLDAVKKFTDENDCFAAAGNHEFSLFVGEAKEDEAYRNTSLAKVQASFKNDIRFSSRIVNGVNLVALDNSYYLVDPWQLERLKAEVEKGLPIILLVHTPLYNEELYNHSLSRQAYGAPAYLMSVPEEKMRHYSPDRYEQQKEDATTAEAYRFISETRLFKAILCGHLHYDYETVLFGFLPQYVVGVGSARELFVR